MKLTRKTSLKIVAALGIMLIGYGVVGFISGFRFDENIEKYLFNGIIIAALLLFFYNRKTVQDEKLAKDAEEETKNQPEEDVPSEPEKKNDSD